MKKLFFIIVLFVAFGQLSNAQRGAKNISTETVGFWTLDTDTIQITRLDKIVKGSIYVPSFSTDSVIIEGCTFTIDGTVTNGITIPPGEATVNFGFDYAYSDSVKITVKDKAWLMLLKHRD